MKKKILLLIVAIFLVTALLLINFVFNVKTTSINNRADFSSKNELSDGSISELDFYNDEIWPEIFINEPIKLLFFGDLMLDRHVREKINKYGLNYLIEKLIEDDFTNSYDIVGANLEGAVTNNGAHYPPENLYDFAFSPEVVAELKNYNFNFFNLANNHLSDQGQKGIRETYQNLSDLGFYYSGCRDAFLSESLGSLESSEGLEEVSNPIFTQVIKGEAQPVLSEENCSEIILNIKNRRVAFLGFSIVYRGIDEDRIIERIGALKEESDFVVVNVHFGIEYQPRASVSQVNLARKMVDNGADVIIGHHPHVIQNYETYQGKPIFYSLGNFIFDQYFSPETQEGLAVAITLGADGDVDSEIYKIKTSGSRVEEILNLSDRL